MSRACVQSGLYVEVEIRGIKTMLLVDTGATDTILSNTVYYRIPNEKKPELTRYGTNVCNADGSRMETMGSSCLELKVGRTVCSIRVIFGNTGSAEGILGMDFLIATHAKIDLQQLQLDLNGDKIKCSDKLGHGLCFRVVVEETTKIPPGHEALVPGLIKGNPGEAGLGILEPTEENEVGRKGVMVARILAESTDNTVPIRVYNPGDRECTIKRGTMAGYFTPVKETDVVDMTMHTSNDEDTGDVPPHLVDLLKRSKTEVPNSFHDNIAELLRKNQDVFAKSDTDIGRTNLVRHGINTGNASTIKERPRRFPPKEQQEIDSQIQDMLQSGSIVPTESPWASNVVLVRKKDGSKRFCIDYRRLNNVTVKDAFPIPRIDETLDTLGGSEWFSTLDLASGYWQVELDEDAQKKSAFVVRGGLYSWRVMPFGLCNAPSTFERLMERVLAGLHWKVLLVYLDDVIVFAKTVDEELTRLETVFQRLRDAGLKLKPRKCHLFKRSVLYLGHVVSPDGISTDPEKIKVVEDWPVPTSVKEVQSFLGLASYYRRFIGGFANIARPLHQLTEKGREFIWTNECDCAFSELKEHLLTAPVLAYPDPEKSYILDTDASNVGIGAVLSQEVGGKERVIAYASRALSKPERNYCVTRRELLAVVVYLKHFRQYLYGSKITVRTDHGALRWLLNFRDPQAQMARWLQVIAEYDIEIVHRAGRSHSNADSLSRRPCVVCKQCGGGEPPLEEQQKIPEVHIDNGVKVNAVTLEPSITSADMRDRQQDDSSMSWVIEVKEKGEDRANWSTMSSSSAAKKAYWRCWDQLEIRNGVLCRRWESNRGDQIEWHVVLPEVLRKMMVQEIHSGPSGGHLGMRRTMAKVRQRFYWPGLDTDVRSTVRQCNVCASKKSPNKTRRAPLQQHQVGMPMERVALDIMGPLPESERGNRYIMVVGDYFTRWMEAYAIPDQKATTVATEFVNQFVCRFGVPSVLHSDQGRNFESAVFREMCSVLGIEKTRTTPYNPKSDGLIERFNRTLITIVSMAIEPTRRQRDWDEKLPLALFAYRSSPQESTGETPNMLMLGREVHLPIDLSADLCKDDRELDRGLDTDYAENLRNKMRLAHERARENTSESSRRQKKVYDRKAHAHELTVGQFVWCYNSARTKGLSPKLQRRWKGPFLIIHRLSDVVYRIQAKNRGKKMVVHADRLKPYLGEPLASWIEEPTSQQVDHAEEESGISQTEDLVEDGVGIQAETGTEQIRDISEGELLQSEADSTVQQSPVPAPIPAPRRNPPRTRNAPGRLLYEI